MVKFYKDHSGNIKFKNKKDKKTKNKVKGKKKEKTPKILDDKIEILDLKIKRL